jgi:chloride channel 7
MGVIAFAVNGLVEVLTRLRLGAALAAVERGAGGAGAFAAWVGLAGLLAAVAGGLVAWVEPLGAGSGIPELKSYLNGVHLRGLLALKTLGVKLVGIAFSIASGLIAGKEGPFVHGGGVVGGGIAQLGSRSLKFALPARWGAGIFRAPGEHRDFVAIGTAAGVATAFGAPVGGLLFTIEEGCSFYSTSVFWRGFLATSMGVMVLHFLEELKSNPLGIMTASLGVHRDFGLYADFATDYGKVFSYYWWELGIFAAMGALGGGLGGLFVWLNVKITAWRHRWVPVGRPLRRHAEVILVAFFTAVLTYAISRASPCPDLPARLSEYPSEDIISDSLDGGPVPLPGGGSANSTSLPAVVDFPRLWCAGEGTYSAWGQLFFTPIAETLKRLLHLGEGLEGYEHQFSFSGLALLAVFTFTLMTLTYGVSAPTGLFVPSLLVGAAWGRMAGRLVRAALAPLGVQVHLPVYAVIGAAASLGGATRMTLSITVLVVETTGAVQLTVPIMLAIFVAKVVGDRLTLGIYDTHIKIRGAPMLEEAGLSAHHRMISEKLDAAELMSDELVAVPPVAPVARLVGVLEGCGHGAFPVSWDAPIHERAELVAQASPLGELNPPGLALEGSVSRALLLRLLKHRVGFVDPGGLGGETDSPPKSPQGEQGTAISAAGDSGAEGGGGSGLRVRTAREAHLTPGVHHLPASQAARLDLEEKLEQLPFKVRTVRNDERAILCGLSEAEMRMAIDLRPFMQRQPHVVSPDVSLARVYRLFRTLGLRHVFVGAQAPQVVGVLTRKDLIEEASELRLAEKAVEQGAEGRAGAAGSAPPPPSTGPRLPYLAGMDYLQASPSGRAPGVSAPGPRRAGAGRELGSSLLRELPDLGDGDGGRGAHGAGAGAGGAAGVK